MGSNAKARYEDLIAYVDQLIDAHSKIREGRGRRHNQEALHRAGVVLTVAAWEAYFEQVVAEAHELILTHSGTDLPAGDANGPPAWARHLLLSKRKGLKEALAKMHTPNWQNVQRLVQEWLMFDPTTNWHWRAPRRNWTATDMRKVLDAWLQIRHKIAHGGDLPDNISWLKGANGTPRLVLDHMRACKDEISQIVVQTDDAFKTQLQVTYGIANPW